MSGLAIFGIISIFLSVLFLLQRRRNYPENSKLAETTNAWREHFSYSVYLMVMFAPFFLLGVCAILASIEDLKAIPYPLWTFSSLMLGVGLSRTFLQKRDRLDSLPPAAGKILRSIRGLAIFWLIMGGFGLFGLIQKFLEKS